jgi:BRCA1-associated protein
MPSYFYHLKFELYPYPQPPHGQTSAEASDAPAKASHAEAPPAWIPPPGSDIFETREWPRHQRAGHLGETGETQLEGREYESLTGVRKGVNGACSAEGGEVIDCGTEP